MPRTWTALAVLAAALVTVAPAAAEDPTFSVPDPSGAVLAASGAVGAVQTAALATHQANVDEAKLALGDLQRLTVPASRVSTIAASTGALGRTAAAQSAVAAGAVLGFAGDAAATKIRESGALLPASDDTVANAIRSAGSVAAAAEAAVCRAPLEVPPAPSCAPGSIGGQALASIEDARAAAETIEPSAAETEAAVRAVLGSIITLP